jgi:subtilisin family serine protease
LVVLTVVASSAACSSAPTTGNSAALTSGRTSISLAAATPGLPSRRAGSTITLITGDRLTVAAGPNGDQLVRIERAPGRDHIGFFRSTVARGKQRDLVVVPSDALPLLDAGRLDRRLFNVSALVRQGFADSADATLPLIISHAGTPQRSLASLASRPTRWLSSLNSEAVAVKKADAATLWSTLISGNAARHNAAPVLANGIAKVWLDGRASLLLDQSVPQIGAPLAWQNGWTGKGVTVAILDTGIKADHPDLVGKVQASRDFTGTDPSVDDDVGHGTHVAGIITGSGAASNGKYRGVAPDVTLLIGKVCVVNGCSESAIIAGMEWAAPQARIISMSLGGDATDGTDPMSQAVNQLTAQYGALFVAAAGNNGVGAGVSSPAAADAALAVASVTKQDQMSDFSSRGPRVGDYAAKPEIAAPGSSIVSARAKGTPVGDEDPIDDNYTRLSGTSMATPHVSGAAAILLQQHPTWSAAELKAALVGSAKPLAGAGIADEGAGRLDVARATTQNVYASDSGLSFGVVRWPHQQPALHKSVTYRNEGDVIVTLQLALSATDVQGAPAPAGLFAYAAQVDVPAHGTSSVDVTVTPTTAGAIGFYSGLLTATSGAIAIETPVDVFEEPESYDVTLRHISRNGAPPTGVYGMIIDDTTGAIPSFGLGTIDATGISVIRLVKGTYDFIGFDQLIDTATNAESDTLIAEPSVVVDKDLTLVRDARRGKLVTASVDRQAPVLTNRELGLRSAPNSPNAGELGGGVDLLPTAQPTLYAVPTRPAPGHTFRFAYRTNFASPAAAADPYTYNLAFTNADRIPAELSFRVHDDELAVVDARYHAQGAAVRGERFDEANLPLMLAGYPALTSVSIPGKRTEYYSVGKDISWYTGLWLTSSDLNAGIDAVYGPDRPFERKHYRIDWNKAALGPSFGPTGWGIYRIGNVLAAFTSAFSPGDIEQNGYSFAASGFSGTVQLTQGNQLIGSSGSPGVGVFAIPAGDALYTLELTATRNVPWSVIGTSVDTTWTFHSAAAADPQASVMLPAIVVRATGPIDENDVAPAGTPYILTLTVQRQTSASAPPLRKLGLEVSYDDGQSWQPALVGFLGDHGVALLFHPKGPGFVSLRFSASDADGNTLKQTVLRAYQIGDTALELSQQ